MGNYNDVTSNEVNDTINQFKYNSISGKLEGGVIIEGKAFDISNEAQTYLAGRLSYDPDSLTVLADTGISSVRVNIGQEEHYLVCNNSGAQIDNGKIVYASGVDSVGKCLEIDLASNASPVTSSQVLGLATHNIPDGQIGLVTFRGVVRDFDTSLLAEGGLQYLGTSGELLQTKPLYPASRIIMGTVLESNATTGKFQVSIVRSPRTTANRSFSFNAQSIDKHWVAGSYDWPSTDANLTQASTSVTYGANVSKAAHVGIVPAGPGTVDSGQVGLRVVGTEDSETGIQVAAQTGIITEDITTLTLNTMVESVEKFSGNVTIEFYIVSGTPTTYSLDFNYGFSKYEDKQNIDMTVIGLEAEWEGGATDNGMDVILYHHKPTGWTYAATGFTPGDGVICQRSVDQQLIGGVLSGESGHYKRIGLDTFISGSTIEGYIIAVVTTANNSISNMNLHVIAEDERLR